MHDNQYVLLKYVKSPLTCSLLPPLPPRCPRCSFLYIFPILSAFIQINTRGRMRGVIVLQISGIITNFASTISNMAGGGGDNLQQSGKTAELVDRSRMKWNTNMTKSSLQHKLIREEFLETRRTAVAATDDFHTYVVLTAQATKN